MDRLANRFDPSSEISEVNPRSGHPVRVSSEFADVLAAALRVAKTTDGAVDPTVGAALYRYGYDRDFSLLGEGVASPVTPPEPAPGWRSVTVDPAGPTVTVPRGCLLDLGSVAKALAADRIAGRGGRQGRCGGVGLTGRRCRLWRACPDDRVHDRHRRPLGRPDAGGDGGHLRRGHRHQRDVRSTLAGRRRMGTPHHRPGDGQAGQCGVVVGHRPRHLVRGGQRRFHRGSGDRIPCPEVVGRPRPRRPVRR